MNIIKLLAEAEERARKFGFQWLSISDLINQIKSECQEIADLADKREAQEALAEEIGDCLHAVICLCLFCKLDPEKVMEKSLEKFQRRFEEMLRLAKLEGLTSFANQSQEAILEFWNKAKKAVG